MLASTANQNPVTRRSAIIGFSLGTLFFGYAFIQRVAPSIMTNELMRDFAVGGTALGSLSAFYFYAYASIQLPVGILTDRYGPRKLMSFAAALCAIASLGFALSDSLITASIGRGFIGATVAFAFVGTLAIAGHWFKPAQYAMLAGILQTVGMTGAIFGQAPLRYVVESVGWRGIMGLLAMIALALSVLLFMLVPQRSQAQRKVEARSGVLDGVRLAASNPQTWLCALIGFGLASIMLGFGALWAVPWLNTVHGYSTTEAAGIASMLFVGWAVFSPLMGWMSDRMGRRNPIMILGSIICLITFAVIIFITPTNTAILMTLIFITGLGGSTMTICFSSVKEHNSLDCSSTALSLMNMCVVGSGAVMQPLIGGLLDWNWDGTVIDGVRVYSAVTYTIALSSLLVVTAGALIGTLLLRETRCKQVG
ncbi:MFS transporter [Candidatus Spongiihabitans sp.]|uniref:MFS transporter n=1 Tax=Candidatus Spongiihabitans sp. TaxID=3101308 RepID=UPI003C7D5DB7